MAGLLIILHDVSFMHKSYFFFPNPDITVAWKHYSYGGLLLPLLFGAMCKFQGRFSPLFIRLTH